MVFVLAGGVVAQWVRVRATITARKRRTGSEAQRFREFACHVL
jgi:hypothetical protein